MLPKEIGYFFTTDTLCTSFPSATNDCCFIASVDSKNNGPILTQIVTNSNLI